MACLEAGGVEDAQVVGLLRESPSDGLVIGVGHAHEHEQAGSLDTADDLAGNDDIGSVYTLDHRSHGGTLAIPDRMRA